MTADLRKNGETTTGRQTGIRETGTTGDPKSILPHNGARGTAVPPIRRGIRGAIGMTTLFSLAISAIIFACAEPLMRLFVSAEETEIVAIGVEYLRVEGSFYVGIGYLFLLYGFYRAVRRPEMSVVLTVLSLGTRVVLAYALAAIPAIGVHGIWWSIPIGWALADIVGVWYFLRRKHKLGIAL